MKKAKLKLTPFDPAKRMKTAEERAWFLDAAFATGDHAYIAKALGVVARAAGMTKVAKLAGVSREALYVSLSAEGNPQLSTVIGVTKAVGYSLGRSAPGQDKAVSTPATGPRVRVKALKPKKKSASRKAA